MLLITRELPAQSTSLKGRPKGHGIPSTVPFPVFCPEPLRCSRCVLGPIINEGLPCWEVQSEGTLLRTQDGFPFP